MMMASDHIDRMNNLIKFKEKNDSFVECKKEKHPER